MKTTHQIRTVTIVLAVMLALLVLPAASKDPTELLVPDGQARGTSKPLKVYPLAGQSNMQDPGGVETFDVIGQDPGAASLLIEIDGPDGKPDRGAHQHLVHWKAGCGLETKREYLLDEQGRHLIPGGYVVIETVRYTRSDYRRMVRMGANFQVIRVPLGKIGGWRDVPADPTYLKRFDTLVQLGKEAGLRTIFKLVVYGIRPFRDKEWDMLWRNTDGAQERLMAAWRRIWTRYRDESSVFGYDLLNEPQRGLDRDYDRCQQERLLPLLRRLTDAMHGVSPHKWVLYQPLLRKQEDQQPRGKQPVVAIQEPFGRERVIYAPHLYQMDLSVIKLMLDAFERQAALSKAPLLLGEWGSPTRATTDGNPAEQARYTKVYQVTANELDGRCIGGIKPWFCGFRKPIPVAGSTNWMTWSIFSDKSPAGRVERKYITDVLARPRPLVVAGRLQRYGNDFAADRFEMMLQPDPSLGATEIFVPTARTYPRGFCIEVGPGLTLQLAPGETLFRTVRAVDRPNREQAKLVQWNDDAQHVIIRKWVGHSKELTVRVVPRVLKLGR